MSWGQIFGIIVLAIFALVILANAKKIAPFIRNLKIFIEEVRFEMGKVSWPSQSEVVNSTVLVGVMTLILTFAIWLVDLAIGQLVRLVF
jgi:preprotein translocase subunit SecE